MEMGMLCATTCSSIVRPIFSMRNILLWKKCQMSGKSIKHVFGMQLQFELFEILQSLLMRFDTNSRTS